MIRTPLSTVIGGAFWTPSCTVIGGNTPASDQQIQKLFSNGEQGFFYDPSDLSTMFQDAAGTIPVTAAGQPVGLMLDKSKGLVLGLETNTNASFNDWSGGKPVGYNLFKNDATTFIEQSINGVRMRSTDGANVQLTRGIAAGKYYEVVINVDSVLSGSVALESQGTRVKLIASSGVHTFRFYALSTGLDLKRGGGVTDFTIRSLSIKEIAGNHAYQTSSAGRPTFQQTPILGANFITDSTLAEPSKWKNTGVASGISVSGNKLIFNNVAAYHTSVASSLSEKLTAGKRYLLSYNISGYVSGTVRAQLIGGASINTAGFNKNGRVSLFVTATSEHSFIGFQSVVAGTTLNISEVYLQEVTGYLTEQNHIKYDGIDDRLTTNLPAQLTGCTVMRSVLNVGTQILTNQTVPTPYNDNIDNCGLIVINRALTPSETSSITDEFNKRAGV